MSPFLIGCLLTVTLLIAVGLYRVWAGPTVFDRLVAVALVSVNGVVVLVLLGITLGRPDLFFDIALGFALLAFLLPSALGRYFEEQRPSPTAPTTPTAERHDPTAPTAEPLDPTAPTAERHDPTAPTAPADDEQEGDA